MTHETFQPVKLPLRITDDFICLVDRGTDHPAMQTLPKMIAGALLAERQQEIPEGWQLVPKEPTFSMLQRVFNTDFNDGEGINVKIIYRAMLAAAPPPPKTAFQE